MKDSWCRSAEALREDSIKRFGGSTAPSAPWPREANDEEDTDKLSTWLKSAEDEEVQVVVVFFCKFMFLIFFLSGFSMVSFFKGAFYGSFPCFSMGLYPGSLSAFACVILRVCARKGVLFACVLNMGRPLNDGVSAIYRITWLVT